MTLTTRIFCSRQYVYSNSTELLIYVLLQTLFLYRILRFLLFNQLTQQVVDLCHVNMTYLLINYKFHIKSPLECYWFHLNACVE
jgi:hypothetical protein